MLNLFFLKRIILNNFDKFLNKLDKAISDRHFSHYSAKLDFRRIESRQQRLI